jgi:hypothetical protein
VDQLWRPQVFIAILDTVRPLRFTLTALFGLEIKRGQDDACSLNDLLDVDSRSLPLHGATRPTVSTSTWGDGPGRHNPPNQFNAAPAGAPFTHG